MTTPTIVDIVHMLATAEKAIAEGSTALGFPMVRDALALLRDHPGNDLGALDVALRMRDAHEILHHLRHILASAPSVYGTEAAEAIDTVRAAG